MDARNDCSLSSFKAAHALPRREWRVRCPASVCSPAWKRTSAARKCVSHEKYRRKRKKKEKKRKKGNGRKEENTEERAEERRMARGSGEQSLREKWKGHEGNKRKEKGKERKGMAYAIYRKKEEAENARRSRRGEQREKKRKNAEGKKECAES